MPRGKVGRRSTFIGVPELKRPRKVSFDMSALLKLSPFSASYLIM